MKQRHYALIFSLIGFVALAGCTAANRDWPTPTVRSSTPTPVPTISPSAAILPATPQPTAIPAPRTTPAPMVTATSYSTPLPTPTPSPTSFPWLLAFDSDVAGNDEIYLLPADGGAAVNLTHHPAEDRYPAWSPDGNRIAFQSHRDGNWELYTLDLMDGALTRLTFNPAYDGAPTWSPDGNWIAFESYRDSAPCQSGTLVPNPPACPDLEIYRVPAGGGPPQQLTDSPGGDHQPAWSPDGNWIAFTSWRDGDQKVYIMPAAGGLARNLTRSAGVDGWPAWSPDGQGIFFLSQRSGLTTTLYRQSLTGGPPVPLTAEELPHERPSSAHDGSLLYARYDPGPAFEAYDPYYPGAYHLYYLSSVREQSQPMFLDVQARRPAVAPGIDLDAALAAAYPAGVSSSPPTGRTTMHARGAGEARLHVAGSLPRRELKRLDDVQAPDPRLVEGVDDAFRAWRAAVLAQSGHDFIGRVSDIYRPAGYYGHRLGYLSWHKTGRAVDLLFDWHDAEGKNALYVVREDIAGEVYWRLYLKCAVQDGSIGAPLTRAPWHFWWHTAPPGHPEQVANGGQPLPIPPGYFIDVTALAERYGWSRIASYHLEDFNWQRDSTATEYWHYQHTDGLTWYEAMAQIHPQELLETLFSRDVAAAREQTEAVMDGKALPLEGTPIGRISSQMIISPKDSHWREPGVFDDIIYE